MFYFKICIQPAVEAFFLVHASSSDKEEKTSTSRETREAQLAHLQQELPPVSPIQASSDARAHVNDTEMFETGSGVLDTSHIPAVTLSSDTKKFLKFAGKYFDL